MAQPNTPLQMRWYDCFFCLRPSCLAAGFSDTVYAEAYVTVHQYDIVLDVSVVNRTANTLQVRGV